MCLKNIINKKMLIQMIQTIIRSKTETVVFFADFKEKNH